MTNLPCADLAETWQRLPQGAAAQNRKITTRQTIVLAAIHNAIAGTGQPPSSRELMPILGVSAIRGVTDHMDRLARKGCLTRLPHASRAITITPAGYAALRAHLESTEP
jgi:SOS-response transcriptional repressor LexA